ncbi:potassium/proton antiporter [Carnobacteriaceae bacterium zg-ZUI252]|nr:potassium/proton antiporter [Carnobacteriaceae bacterium zg-ZUI252]MBS4770036.1 potassium/proton antiporter [Carnobacteriaceae bacterium zg-ZUI240]
MNLSIVLIFCAIVIVGCLLLQKLTNRIGVPYLVGFIILGMLFGSDGVLRIQFENFRIAQIICTVALIFIMFFGGFETRLNKVNAIMKPAVVLSTGGVLLTALMMTAIIHFILRLSVVESFLISAVLSSTDAASVFSILKSQELHLKHQTASLLELESGSNDPFAYLLAVVGIFIFKGQFQISEIFWILVLQIGVALLVTVVLSKVTRFIFDRMTFDNVGILVTFIMAVALLSYALPEAFKGNGYLSAYLVGLILGNHYIPQKKEVMVFFEGVISICQILTFFLLGLLSAPKLLPDLLVLGGVIAVVLMLVVRPIVVWVIGKVFHLKKEQMTVISWAGLRGASSIVFSIMIVNQVHLTMDIFHIVLCVVLVSIIIQGTLLPIIARRTNMIDVNENVFKTFNFYSEEVPLDILTIRIPETHAWANRAIETIDFPPSTLVFQIQRDEELIVPDGQTVLQVGDLLQCVVFTRQNHSHLKFYQINVEDDSRYLGKVLKDSIFSQDLVVAIERDGHMIVPNGDTMVLLGDTLLMKKMTGNQ